MICSSEFSFSEDSVWDPKGVRQLLIISEDQLNILNNIPEWTKEKDDNYYSRIKVNDSCTNTQVELSPSNTLLRNQEVINSNIELFDKNFDSRENIIQAYKLNALKLSKSISLFEIDKISTNSPCRIHLSPALSLPNLSLFSKDFSVQFENKSSLCEKSDLSTQLNLGILSTGKSKTCIENPNMEVISQLPAVVPQIDKNNENFAIVDKDILSASQTTQSSDNSSNSCDLLPTFVDVNKSDQLRSIVTKKTNLVESDKLDSGDDNVASNEKKQIIVSNSNNLDLQENTTKLAEPTDLHSHEKMETDSSLVGEPTVKNCIHDTSEKIKLSELEDVNKKNKLQVTTVEENVINNASSLNKEKSNTDVEGEILNKSNETSVEISKQPGVDSKLCESKITVVSSDELKSKITDISYDSKLNAEIVLKTACQGAGDGKAVITQNLPLKRKSDSKARSSKRSKSSREKQGCLDERSIKKAGEICYSSEDTKIIFDLLKLFF